MSELSEIIKSFNIKNEYEIEILISAIADLQKITKEAVIFKRDCYDNYNSYFGNNVIKSHINFRKNFANFELSMIDSSGIETVVYVDYSCKEKYIHMYTDGLISDLKSLPEPLMQFCIKNIDIFCDNKPI